MVDVGVETVRKLKNGGNDNRDDFCKLKIDFTRKCTFSCLFSFEGKSFRHDGTNDKRNGCRRKN